MDRPPKFADAQIAGLLSAWPATKPATGKRQTFDALVKRRSKPRTRPVVNVCMGKLRKR